ncbi:MAG: endonuclease MutS2 [Eubacteriales bacterium]
MEFSGKAIKTLEFDKVIARLKRFITTESGKAAADGIVPDAALEDVEKKLSETAKARQMLVKSGMPSFGQGRDIKGIVERAKKGSVLAISEILEVLSLLQSAKAVKSYPTKSEDLETLGEYFLSLSEENILKKAITEAITGDSVADSASAALLKIRRSITKCELEIRNSLSKYTSGAFGKYLQENIVTQRNGRFVVPVKAEYKNEIKGFLHDTSASGATLFIEPLAVLEGNNKLRELKSAEKKEIEKILTLLSQKAALSGEALLADYNSIAELSLIFGKAAYSLDNGGVSPKMSDKKRVIDLQNARHPLIDKDKVVPVSLSLGEETGKSLVITGPNTGGKTVTLKTLGLFALMAQSGLEIPCKEGSALPVFDKILADIGDEQSIEQSLSTFSSHMKNIVGIIGSATRNSLVLLDELGAGTDPAEGAALGIAILEELRQRGAFVAATTHYAELKVYAIEREGVVNASLEFDLETLRPTFRLVTGLPGKSNAFAISLRLGLPERLIDAARERLSAKTLRLDSVISKLELTESAYAKDHEKAVGLRREAEALLAEAKEKMARAEEEIITQTEKANEKANRIIAQARSSSEFIFDELNKLKKEAEKEKNFTNLELARQSIKDRLKKSHAAISQDSQREEKDYSPPRPYRPGDAVKIAGINKKGFIEQIDGQTATVKAGIITTKVAVSDLRLLEEKPEIKKSAVTFRRSEAVKNELDIRGLTGDEAYFALDKYLDAAILASYGSVSIIHGKGTGALRAAVWENLRRDKRVKTFRSGFYGEGDTGVTVVELKV